jgi:hypothetical protein
MKAARDYRFPVEKVTMPNDLRALMVEQRLVANGLLLGDVCDR